MPWNGSGQFNRDTGVFTGATVWDDSRVAGRTVRADDHDTHDEDLATGLENTVTRDGQNSPSANLPMATFRHTGVGNAAARTDYAAAGQIQDQSLTHVVAASVGGTADAITLSPSPAITAYAAGQRWSFLAEAINTTAVTVNVSALGAKAVQKLGVALVAGDLTTGDLVEIEYDGTQFQMLTPARTLVLTAGSIAGASLANGAVDTTQLADDAVTLAKMAPGTDGNLISYDISGDPVAVATGTSGQVLTSNGAGTAPTFQDAVAGGLVGIQVITTTGGVTYNATAGTNSVEVELQGGGGGGGNATNTSGNRAYGGGGGQGGRAIERITSAFDGVTVTIGPGGAASLNGGTTSFGALLQATGGNAGADATDGVGNGGAGGVGSLGDLNITGAPGGRAHYGHNPTATNAGEIGAGGRGGGEGGAVHTTGNNNGSAGADGGGGSGASRDIASASTNTGGAGGDGWCIIREYS